MHLKGVNNHQTDIVELVGRARAGDRAALGEIIHRYQDMVHATCLRLTGDEAAADDLTHDSLVEACLRLGHVRNPERFGGWLKTLTLNVFRMWYRKRIVTVQLDDQLAAPDESGDDSWVASTLSICLAQLSAEHRIVLALHYLEQLSYADIAALLDLPIGTVMSRLYRARLQLKSHLSEHTQNGGRMVPSDDMTQEVLEELSVLDEVFKSDPGVARRFSVLVEEQPERLRQFIAGTTNNATIEQLGIILRRQPTTAVRIALDLALGGPGAARSNALLALKIMVGGYVVTHQHSCGNYPEVQALMFAGMCAEHDAPVRDKARLILDLLPAFKQPKVRTTFQLLLVCMGPEAVRVALDDFEALDGTSTSGPSPLLDTLCRSGTPFCEALSARLKRERGRSALLALSWAGRLGERMEAYFVGPSWNGCFEEWQRSFSVVRESQLDPAALQRLRDAVAQYMEDADIDVRGCALRSLGALMDTGRTEAIRPYLLDPSLSVQMDAIRAVSGLRDSESLPILARVAAEGRGQNQVAAIEAIGRIGPAGFTDLLTRLADDTREEVQEAAVIALGEQETKEVRVIITHLAAVGGQRRRRAAAKALHRACRSSPWPSGSEASHKVWVKLRGENMIPRAHISVGVVLREGIAEVRQYSEKEITRIVASLVVDTSTTRRRLVEDGFMTRHNGVYEFTEAGAAAWRLERFIDRQYLRKVEDITSTTQ